MEYQKHGMNLTGVCLTIPRPLEQWIEDCKRHPNQTNELYLHIAPEDKYDQQLWLVYQPDKEPY